MLVFFAAILESWIVHKRPGATYVVGIAWQEEVGTSFLILMGGYLSSCFWSRYPDISNSVAELSWECVVHFHSSIRQSDRVEAEPSVCALGTDYKMQNFIVVTGWSYPMLFKCLIFNVSFFSIFGNTFTTLTGSGSGSFSFANCYAFRAILSKSWFLLCCSTMLPIKQKKQQQTKTNNQKTPPQNQKKPKPKPLFAMFSWTCLH